MFNEKEIDRLLKIFSNKNVKKLVTRQLIFTKKKKIMKIASESNKNTMK